MKDAQDSLRRHREARIAKEKASGKSIHPQPVIQSTSNPKLSLKQKIMQPVITGIVRHLLTALGGGLVADGALDNEQLNIGIGAVVTLVGLGWSIWSNKKAADKGAK